MRPRQTILNRFRPTRAAMPDMAETGFGISGGTPNFINIFGYTNVGQPMFTMSQGKLVPTGYGGGGGLNWNDLVWPAISGGPSGDGIASGSAVMNTVILSGQNFGAGQYTIGAGIGTFIYTGPAVLSNLHIVVTANTGAANCGCNIQIDNSAVLLLLLDSTGSPADFTVGAHDVPFTVPISAGLPLNVVININNEPPGFTNGPSHFAATFTLTPAF